MNILIVTSQVTYIPDNYQVLLKHLTEDIEGLEQINLKAVVSLKSIDFALFKKILGLPLLGVFDLGKNLLLNLCHYKLGKRSKLLRKKGITHLQFEDLNQKEAIDYIKENNIDLIINLRTRCLYKSPLLELPNLGCINVHHGILPKYRGTFCDLYALYEGREAGFSVHHMEKKVDAGIIYDVVTVSNGKERKYETYLKEAEKKESKSLFQFLSYIDRNQKLPPGRLNTCPKPIYTKNPTPATVKAMRLKGMHL